MCVIAEYSSNLSKFVSLRVRGSVFDFLFFYRTKSVSMALIALFFFLPVSALVNSVTSYLHPKHQILYIKENPARTLGIGSAEGEKEVPASKTRGKSSVSSRLQLQSTYNFFRILISSGFIL